jgi:hypothetical protein
MPCHFILQIVNMHSQFSYRTQTFQLEVRVVLLQKHAVQRSLVVPPVVGNLTDHWKHLKLKALVKQEKSLTQSQRTRCP